VCIAASLGSPMARNVVVPAVEHCASVGNRVAIVARGTTVVHGPAASTVSSKLPRLVGMLSTSASNVAPVAVVLTVGLASAPRAAALLQKIAPLSVGQVTPAGVPFMTAPARLLTSWTAPADQVATRWTIRARAVSAIARWSAR